MKIHDEPTEKALRLSYDAVRNMFKLKVLPLAVESGTGSTLLVDASDLTTDPNDVRWWPLDNSDDDPTLWHHAPSHGDEYFPLGDCLLSIAFVYTERVRS